MRFSLLLASMAAIAAPSALASATVGDDTVIEILGHDRARGVVIYSACWRPSETLPGDPPPLPVHEGCDLVHLDVASGGAERRRITSSTHSPDEERRIRRQLARLVPLPRVPREQVQLSRRVRESYRRYHPWHEEELPQRSLDVHARVGSHSGQRSVEAFEHSRVRLRSAYRVPGGAATLVVFAYRGSAFEHGYDVDEVLLLRGRSSTAERFDRDRAVHLSTSTRGLAVRAGERGFTLSFTDEAGCRARVAEVIGASAPRRIGHGRYTAELRAGRLTSRHGVLFDPAPFLCGTANEEPTDERSIGVALLSIYGSFVTIRVQQSVSAGGGPPYHAERWETFDLRDGLPTDVARLLVERLAPEQAVVAALRVDPFIVARGGLGAAPQTFEEARAALERLGIRGLASFAIAGVDPAHGVNLRVAVHHPDGDPPHMVGVRALGVWLPLRVPGAHAGSAVFLRRPDR